MHPSISYNQTRTDGACPDSYTLTRTWTATDNCGNSSSKSRSSPSSTRPNRAERLPAATVTVECLDDVRMRYP